MKHSPEFVAICDEARGRIRELTLEEYLDDPEAWTLVDVREESEFAAGHLPGARLVPRGFLEVKADLQHPKRDPWLADRGRKHEFVAPLIEHEHAACLGSHHTGGRIGNAIKNDREIKR